jgi:predicted DNA-binding protein (MmcQ/YjbR family)
MLAMANPTRAPKQSPRSPAKSKPSRPVGKSAAKSAARPGTDAKKPKAGGAGGGKTGAVKAKAGKAAAPAKAAKPAKAVKASKKAAPASTKAAAPKKLPSVVKGKPPASPTPRPDGVRKPAGASANGVNGKSTRGGADPTTAGLSPADAELVADLLPRLREICLALPEATEVEAWGHPTFRVNDKIFASYGVEGARASMGVKTTPDMQSALVMSDPRFTVAAYVGKHGWVSLSLAGTVDLGEVEMLVRGSYRLIAPARLVRQLDELED